MLDLSSIDKIQFLSLFFRFFIFFFIFSLVKDRSIKEEYSLLWFALSLFLIYFSIDRHAIDRLANLVGVAYAPSLLTLMITGFTFLLLIHITLIISRLSEQNKEMIQEIGLVRLGTVPKEADLLIIVPAYNEEQAIVRVIEDLRGVDLKMDILVINDGSIDSTSAVARATGEATVIDLQKNLGIGGAVQTGFKYAARNGYQTAIQFDGDGQHIAEEIPKLLSKMNQDGSNMVIGSRFLEKHAGFRSTFIRRIGIRVFEGLNSLLIRQRITDNTSGFRAYNRQAIEFLMMHYTIDYPEPETVILLGRNHFKISEVSTKMRVRQGGKSSFAGGGDYYMIKVLLAILMTALRKPIIREKNH
jgi:hypothetical protein